MWAFFMYDKMQSISVISSFCLYMLTQFRFLRVVYIVKSLSLFV